MSRRAIRSRAVLTWVAVAALCGGAPVGDSAAQTSNWPSEGPPRPLAAREVKFPPYQLKTLANGLQVVAVLHHEQPAVSIRLIVHAGDANDRTGRKGVAALAAALVDQGTTTRSAQQIADTIDFIGGSIGAGAGHDFTHLQVMVMKDSFDLAMDLLSDMVRNPGLSREEIERQRQQAMASLQVSYEDPNYIADAVFERLVYGFHPYGLPQGGTPQSLQAITGDDLQNFHRQYFAPNNAILAVVGDITADEAFAAAERVFGNWPRRDITPETFPDPPAPTRRVIVIDKPDAVQTEVRVGHLGITRKSADYLALDLAIKILGGEGSNRLHRVLRSERGLTYGASAEMDAFKQGGDIVAQTSTRTEVTAEALRLIIDEIWRLQRERVSERELADAKAYLSGSFPLKIETPAAIAMQVLNVLFYELPLSDLQTFRERVNAVTPEDIQRVARAYLKPDRLSIVLVGNAAAFTSQLQGLGLGKFETVALSDLDFTTADFRKQAARGIAVPDPKAERGTRKAERTRPNAETNAGFAFRRTVSWLRSDAKAEGGRRNVEGGTRKAEGGNGGGRNAEGGLKGGRRKSAGGRCRAACRRGSSERGEAPLSTSPPHSIREVDWKRAGGAFPAEGPASGKKSWWKTEDEGRQMPAGLSRAGTVRNAEWNARPLRQSRSLTDAAGTRELIELMVAAKGGLEKLKSIKTVVATAETRVMTPQGPLTAETRTLIEYPDRFRVDAKLPVAEIIQSYDQGEAWMKDPNGIHDAPEALKSEFRGSVRRDVIPLLIGAAAGAFRLRVLSNSVGDGRQPVRAIEVSGEDLEPVVLHVDPTGLIIRQTYRTTGPNGSETAEELFSDYRVVDGLQVAFKAILRRGDATVVERTVREFKYNVEFDSDVFKRPSG